MSLPALVLSGGGVRGAYEVGIVAGIVDVLELGPDDPPPFRIFAGTSVGAINSTFLAANTHRGDLNVGALVAVWEQLELREYLRVDPLGLVRHRVWRGRGGRRQVGKSLLDPRPLAGLVRRNIDWTRLRANIASTATHAAIVAALDIATGKTTMFVDGSPDATFRASRDPRRHGRVGPITVDHVLASAALPVLFPARRIGDAYFCDGGLRFNTPIAPAIRTGADRLVVVSLKHEPDTPAPVDYVADYPSLAFLLGKLLNALLLDAVTYDLQVVNRFNRLLDVLEEALTDKELARVHQVMAETRGAPYRRLETLAFSPSADIGLIATDYVHAHRRHWRTSLVNRWLLSAVSQRDSDLASYLLFDGGFATELIRLGRADAHARADELRAMFG